VICFINYQAIEDNDNNQEVPSEDEEKGNREYDLIKILLYYIIIGFLGWIFFSFLFTSSWFEITKININGNHFLDKDTIISQGGIKFSTNLFHFNIQEAGKKLLQNPWIEEVSIKKIFPNQLDINIKERRPAALLFADDSYYLVTEEGKILSIFKNFTNDFNLYIITGLDIGSKKVGEMIDKVEYNEAQRVISALENLFSGQFYKIQIISEEEFLLFHKNNRIKVRIESGDQLLNEWYLLESAIQKVEQEQIPIQEINMKYKERLLIIL